MDLINAGKMEDIQIINDRQVKTTHAYKNTKQKLLKTKAAIWLKKKCSIQTLPPLHWRSQVKGHIIKTYSILPSHLQLGLLSDISHNYVQQHTSISWSITVVLWIWKYENYCDTVYGIVSLTSVTFFLFSSCSSSVDFLSWSRRRFASSRSLSLSRSTW